MWLWLVNPTFGHLTQYLTAWGPIGLMLLGLLKLAVIWGTAGLVAAPVVWAIWPHARRAFLEVPQPAHATPLRHPVRRKAS